jgi:N-acetylmuramoyl-L-alanine amidase
MNIIECTLNFNGEFVYNNDPKRIILHHAEKSVCTIEDIHSWHLQNGWIGIGYHYFVRKDGSIYKGRPENAQGGHCPSQNTQSIGICAEGEYMAEDMPQPQKNAIIELCKDICNRYGITEIAGHKKYYSTDCPGTNYPLEEIKNLVANNVEIKTYLKLGDTGEDVTELQKKLEVVIAAKFNKYGEYDQDVVNAVCYYQQSKDMAIDGKFGDYEAKFLNNEYEEKIKTYSILITPFNVDDLPSVKEKLDSLGWQYTIQEN